MKIFYTSDNSVDNELEQVCPFGEKHHFERKDGSVSTPIIRVGCNGCMNCKFCYGAGRSGYYGSSGNLLLVPAHFMNNESLNYEMEESIAEKLKLKQFRFIFESDYIMCSKCFNENFRNSSKKLKFKIWWWHHIGMRFDHFISILEKWKIDFIVKFNQFRYDLMKKFKKK